MSRSFEHTVVCLAFLATLTFIGLSASLAKDQVPFNGSWNTTHYDTLSFDPTLGAIIAVKIHGEGQASYLGNARCFSDNQTAILATGTIIATYTYTAANGDLVLLHARSQLVGFDPVTRTVHFVGTFEVLDGTGRFAGATGFGTLSGWALFEQPLESPVNSGPGFFEFEGVMTSVGAAKN